MERDSKEYVAARSALKIKTLTKLHQAFFFLCWFLIDPGPTYHWILTQVLQSLTVIVIHTVIDWFSKAAQIIPLPKLPTAKETA